MPPDILQRCHSSCSCAPLRQCLPPALDVNPSIHAPRPTAHVLLIRLGTIALVIADHALWFGLFTLERVHGRSGGQ